MENQSFEHTPIIEVEKHSQTPATVDLSAHQIWEACLGIIRSKISNLNYKTWFEPIVPIKIEQNRLHLRVPSPFFFEWIEEHFYTLINESLGEASGTGLVAQYLISEDLQMLIH